MYRVKTSSKHRRHRPSTKGRVYLITLRGPAMEYRDVRAGESPQGTVHREVRARSQKDAERKAERLAERMHEGLEVVDVERSD